jgi:hypothetical protein
MNFIEQERSSILNKVLSTTAISADTKNLRIVRELQNFSVKVYASVMTINFDKITLM